MANRFSLEADVAATIDEASAERAGEELGQTMEQQIGDLQAGLGGVEGGGGVGGIGGARGGGGGGLGTAAGAGLAGRAAMGGGGIGAAASAAAPVAIAGAVGFGILQGVQRLARASPALRQSLGIWQNAMDLFFRPFGNEIADIIRDPGADALNAMIEFNRLANNEGLGVGIKYLGGEVQSGLASAYGDATEGLFDMVGLEGVGDQVGGAVESYFNGLTARQLLSGPVGLLEGLVRQLTDEYIDLVQETWPGWPDISLPSGFWPAIQASSVLNMVFGTSSVTSGAIVGATYGAVELTEADVLDPLFGGIDIDADDILSEFSFGGGGDQDDTADTRDRRDTTRRDGTVGRGGSDDFGFGFTVPQRGTVGGGTSDELRELRRIRDALSDLDPDINLELPEEYDPF